MIPPLTMSARVVVDPAGKTTQSRRTAGLDVRRMGHQRAMLSDTCMMRMRRASLWWIVEGGRVRGLGCLREVRGEEVSLRLVVRGEDGEMVSSREEVSVDEAGEAEVAADILTGTR